METAKPYTLDRVVRLLIGLTIFLLLFFLIRRLSGVLLPFLVAWLLAYLLQPVVRFFQEKLKIRNRPLAILCTLVVVFGMLTGIVWLLAPLVAVEVQRMTETISLFEQGVSVDTFLPIKWQNEIRDYLSQFDLKSLLQDQNAMSLIKKLMPQMWDLVNNSLSFILGFSVILIVFLYLVFILKDFEVLSTGWIHIIPVKYRPIVSEIFSDIEIGMNRYFRGQFLIAATVGTLFTIGFSIIGFPMAILFGVFVGVLNLVPYLQVVAFVPALSLAFLKSVETGQSFGSVLLGLGIVFIIVQGTQDLFLVPKIMGKVTGLHPAVILLSLSIWGSLMGVVGMIIALPMTTLLISYYNRFVIKEEKIPEEITNVRKVCTEKEPEKDN